MTPRMNVYVRFVMTFVLVVLLTAILNRLPLNRERLTTQSAQRLHSGLSNLGLGEKIGPRMDCTFTGNDHESIPVAEKLQEMGAFGSGEDTSAEPCTVTIRVSGGLYRAVLEREPHAPQTVSSPRILWTSLLPALLAVALAIAFQRLLTALLVGVVVGAALLGADGSFAGILSGATIGTGKIIYSVLTDKFHFYIFLFTFSLIGMVNVASTSGGMAGVANALGRLARSSRSTQMSTALLGLAIFFDDYSNTIVVGSSMRTLSDRVRISREKLAYIVDSTAAPIAGLALISTWIGYEVSLIGDAMKELGLQQSPYAMFLSTIPYRFYCILTLGFVGLNIWMKREYGAMAQAQRRAMHTGEVVRHGSKPLAGPFAPRVQGEPRAVNAAVPVLSVISLTLIGMIANGAGLLSPNGFHPDAWHGFQLSRVFTLQANYIVQCRDGAWVLAMASLTGSALAVVLGRTLGKAPVATLVRSWLSTGRILLLAFSVLILAWSIGEVTSRLGTGMFLVSALAESISPWLLPVIIFCLSAMISFATGSSWGTMAVLLPASVPLAFHVGGVPLMAVSLGAVLDGSIFGDHCSPLSDTTVMSSIAAGCDHMDHVRTQLPYALTVALAASVLGYLEATWLNPLVSYLLALTVLGIFLRVFGRKS